MIFVTSTPVVLIYTFCGGCRTISIVVFEYHHPASFLFYFDGGGQLNSGGVAANNQPDPPTEITSNPPHTTLS